MQDSKVAADRDDDGEATTRIQPARVSAVLEEDAGETTIMPRPRRSGWLSRLLGWVREKVSRAF